MIIFTQEVSRSWTKFLIRRATSRDSHTDPLEQICYCPGRQEKPLNSNLSKTRKNPRKRSSRSRNQNKPSSNYWTVFSMQRRGHSLHSHSGLIPRNKPKLKVMWSVWSSWSSKTTWGSWYKRRIDLKRKHPWLLIQMRIRNLKRRLTRTTSSQWSLSERKNRLHPRGCPSCQSWWTQRALIKQLRNFKSK